MFLNVSLFSLSPNVPKKSMKSDALVGSEPWLDYTIVEHVR